MAIGDSLLYKAYTLLTRSLVTVGVHQILTKTWGFVTGKEPPEPTDPEVDARTALLWALSSAIGVAVAQVVAEHVGYRYFGRGKKHKARKISLSL